MKSLASAPFIDWLDRTQLQGEGRKCQQECPGSNQTQGHGRTDSVRPRLTLSAATPRAAATQVVDWGRSKQESS